MLVIFYFVFKLILCFLIFSLLCWACSWQKNFPRDTKSDLDEDACGQKAPQQLRGDVGEAQQVDIEQWQVLVPSHQGIEIIHHLLFCTRQDPHSYLHTHRKHSQMWQLLKRGGVSQSCPPRESEDNDAHLVSLLFGSFNEVYYYNWKSTRLLNECILNE